jgi:hypothetical protein
MALNWDLVRAEHVREACVLVASGQHAPRSTAKGLFVSHDGRELPAKHVLRLAYLLAHRLPLDSSLRFASGEGTLSRLRALGFAVTRASRT